MLSLIITVAVLGLIVWAITQFIPMPEGFKKAIYVIAIICLVIYLLQAFGIWYGSDIPVPHLR